MPKNGRIAARMWNIVLIGGCAAIKRQTTGSAPTEPRQTQMRSAPLLRNARRRHN